jgi:hypothetical protein
VLSTIPTAVRNPSSIDPIGQASAPSKSISPEAMPRVPTFSLSRRSEKPFGAPPMRRGTTKQPSPAVPSGAPTGRAVTRNWSASATEQNHFSPRNLHVPSAVATASHAFAPTSLPPCTSVRNCDPRSAREYSRSSNGGRNRSRTAGVARRRSARAKPIVHVAGHACPPSPSSDSRYSSVACSYARPGVPESATRPESHTTAPAAW